MFTIERHNVIGSEKVVAVHNINGFEVIERIIGMGAGGHYGRSSAIIIGNALAN